MKCFSVEEERVTKGLSIIPSPFPHIGIGMGAPGQHYTRIGVSTKFAASLVVRPRHDETWCRRSRLQQGCQRMKMRGGCMHDCRDREIQKIISDAAYASVLECCVIQTVSGGYLLVEPRGGDRRGLVHLKLQGRNVLQLSFFRRNAGGETECIAVDDGAAHFDFSSQTGHFVPVEKGDGVSILAGGGILRGNMESNIECLMVMQPGSAFVAARQGGTLPPNFAAIFDGEKVYVGPA